MAGVSDILDEVEKLGVDAMNAIAAEREANEV